MRWEDEVAWGEAWGGEVGMRSRQATRIERGGVMQSKIAGAEHATRGVAATGEVGSPAQGSWTRPGRRTGACPAHRC